MRIIELLLKAVWTNSDIEFYCNCSKTKASQIHQKAVIEHDGAVLSIPSGVKRDAVLETLGIDHAAEIEKLKSVLEIGGIIQ